MSETTYYQKYREMILNRAKDYYENNKELLRERERERERERAKNKYREYRRIKEEKNIKTEYGKKRYHNMSEGNKKKIKEYHKIIVRLKNMLHKCKCVSKSVLQIYIFLDLLLMFKG